MSRSAQHVSASGSIHGLSLGASCARYRWSFVAWLWVCCAGSLASPLWGFEEPRADQASAPPPRLFPVRDFGAAPDDAGTDAGPGIRAAIQAAIQAGTASEVVLEPGTYRVAPERPRQPCFPILNARALTVRGAGAGTRIICTDPTAGGFLLASGVQVAIRDLTIDYDPLPFCQGTIRAKNAETGSFDLDVDPDFPTPDAPNFLGAEEPFGKWGMILDPATRRIRAGTPDHYMTPRFEHVEGRTWRFFTANEHHRRMLDHMRVGDAYVHLARGYGSAVLAQACDGVRIVDLTVHASPGLAVGLVGNRGEVLVRGLRVAFATNSKRLITTDADGVHCQQNRSGPIIEDCFFEGMADDAINIYAPPNVLREVQAPDRWLVSPLCLVLPGDRLQVVEPGTGRIRGEVRATRVDIDRGKLAFVLTLEKPLDGAVAGADHRSADTLYNLDACGAGFQVRRNHMKGNRRYGCLLRAGGGLVEDNLFEDTTGAGVVMTNEPDWPEGPIPWGITVRNNRFVRGGTCLGYADSPQGAALAARAVRLGHGLADDSNIDSITIEANTFTDRAGAAIYLGGTRQARLQGNRIEAGPEAGPPRIGGAIVVERSRGVVVRDTTIRDRRPGTTAGVEVLPSVDPGESGMRVETLSAELGPEASGVLDHRLKNP